MTHRNPSDIVLNERENSMIRITRVNGESFYVNCDLIQFIETTPDTIITLVNAKKLTVKEKPEQIIDAIVKFRCRIFPFVQEEQLKKKADEG